MVRGGWIITLMSPTIISFHTGYFRLLKILSSLLHSAVQGCWISGQPCFDLCWWPSNSRVHVFLGSDQPFCLHLTGFSSDNKWSSRFSLPNLSNFLICASGCSSLPSVDLEPPPTPPFLSWFWSVWRPLISSSTSDWPSCFGQTLRPQQHREERKSLSGPIRKSSSVWMIVGMFVPKPLSATATTGLLWAAHFWCVCVWDPYIHLCVARSEVQLQIQCRGHPQRARPRQESALEAVRGRLQHPAETGFLQDPSKWAAEPGNTVSAPMLITVSVRPRWKHTCCSGRRCGSAHYPMLEFSL